MTLHASTGLLPPSNTAFQAIGDALPCAVIQLVFPDSAELASTCSFVAGPFEGLTGISREAQLLNPHAFEKHVVPADQSALRAWMKESSSAARVCLPLAHETHIRLALNMDGELRHLQLNCAYQADAHGVTMTGYLQKSSPADSISAAQDAHQRLLDAMPIPAYVLDASGIYICVNRAFEDAFGLAPTAVLGKDTAKIELFHVMQRHKFKMDQMAVLSSGTALQSLREAEPAKRARRKDLFFESCMYRADGIVDGLIGIAIDVQESAEAQRKLTALQNHMRTVLESAPSALIISDQDGQVLFNNERALTVFRVDAQRLRSEGVALCDAGPAHRPSSIEFGGLGGAFTGMEIERKRGDGSIFWARVASSVGDFGGQQATFTWTDDISERRAAADALLAAKESAESAAATKSAFLANMSHEIRTPMNAIIGLAHLALRTKLTTQQRDYVQKVHGAGQNLLGIINDILDFSKIEAGKLEVERIAFNLDEVLTQVSTVTSSKAWDKGLELLFEVPGDVPRSLVSDPLRLGQVLINLVNNAVKFTEKGQILVKCRAETLPAGVPVAGSQTGQPGLQNVCLNFSVHDTGIGMTPEQCSRLFTAFSQADETTTRKFGGTGLGLSISKKLAEMMGGSIGVKSQADVGSEFYFSWHCRVAAEVTPVKRRLPEGLAGLKVLVVDDNAAARNILYEALREFDFEVDMVSSGAEAYAAVQSSDKHAPFRIMFTDWNMPGMDGLALIDKVKADRALINAPACVLVTAFGRDEIRQKAEQRMTDGFLVKPINQSTLVDTLVRLLSADLETDAQAYSDNESVPRLHGLRVLLAEDNEINQQIAIELLQSAGVEVDVASNGRIAVDRLNSVAAGTYHLVLMDLQMPQMDGHEATQEIRRNPLFKDTPIIAMTAHAMVEERERCLAEGMNDHITKPIDPALLYKTLQQWGGHAVMGNSLSDELDMPKPVAPEAVADIDLEGLQALIPSLDLQGALRRVAGNRALYVRLLKRYCEEQSQAIARIHECLERKDNKSAEIRAHTLKGVSANIGADSVAISAAALETALRTDMPHAVLEGLLDSTAAPLSHLIADLTDWFERQEEAPAELAKWVAVPVSDALRAKLASLNMLLDDMDAEAVDRFEELRPELALCMSPAQIRRIQLQLQVFNFEIVRLILSEVDGLSILKP